MKRSMYWLMAVALFIGACGSEQPTDNGDVPGAVFQWYVSNNTTVWADCDTIYIVGDSIPEVSSNLGDTPTGWWSASMDSAFTVVQLWALDTNGARGGVSVNADNTFNVDIALPHPYGDAPFPFDIRMSFALYGTPNATQYAHWFDLAFPTDCPTGGGGGGHGGKEPPPQQGVAQWARDIIDTPEPETIDDAQRLLDNIDAFLSATRDDPEGTAPHCCVGPRWWYDNGNDSTRAALMAIRRNVMADWYYFVDEHGTSVITGLR